MEFQARTTLGDSDQATVMAVAPTSSLRSNRFHETIRLERRHLSSLQACSVERDTDPLHEMSHHYPRLDRLVVDRGPVHYVAARRVAAVGPVQDAVIDIELDVDWLRQAVVEALDVGLVAAVWPAGVSTLARKMRPSLALSGPFCVQ
jgi:hypothetical protein